MYSKINKQAIGYSNKYLERHAYGMVRPFRLHLEYLLGTSMIQKVGFF